MLLLLPRAPQARQSITTARKAVVPSAKDRNDEQTEGVHGDGRRREVADGAAVRGGERGQGELRARRVDKEEPLRCRALSTQHLGLVRALQAESEKSPRSDLIGRSEADARRPLAARRPARSS